MTFRKALLVGINAYPLAPLRGCINDANQIKDLLIKYFSFVEKDIVVLLDGDATYRGIQAGLEWLSQGGDDPDAVRVFHYAGHGSYVADQNGDEPDGRDECLVPVDYQQAGYLSDDLLKELYDQFPKSGNLTLIMDSCHSGTVQRDSALDRIFRFLPVPYEEQLKINAARAKYARDRQQFIVQALRETSTAALSEAELEAKVHSLVDLFDKKRFGDLRVREGNILLAGCRADQTSADAHIGGDFHGAFTYYLVETIAEANYKLSYHDLIEKTGKKLYDHQYTQLPQLECRSQHAQEQIFSVFHS